MPPVHAERDDTVERFHLVTTQGWEGTLTTMWHGANVSLLPLVDLLSGTSARALPSAPISAMVFVWKMLHGTTRDDH